METIGILAAMPMESNALLRLIGQRERSDLGIYRCHRFRLLDRVCWLVTSGMGIRRAAEATRRLIDAAGPQLLVSVGIAGAVQADLQIGNVVVSTETCLLEDGRPGPFQPLGYLSEAAWLAAEKILQTKGVGIYRGTAITTHGAPLTQGQLANITNPILEMETAGIVGVTTEMGIPLLSLRAVSDGPRAPIPFDLEKMMDENDNTRSGEILKTVLSHPRMIPQLVRVGRNSRLAADYAALALFAILSQPGSVIGL